jgi:putative toxin-antitoxin system antitoxin component (TIGR02293 family)
VDRNPSPKIVDAAARLAFVTDLAVELLGDAERAKRWLETPNPYIGNETPRSAVQTQLGTDLVVESLYTIAYGGTA